MSSESIGTILAAVIGATIGGGVASAFINYLLDPLKTRKQSKNAYKEVRYKAILTLCYTYINYGKENHFNILEQRPNLNTQEQILNELMAEWSNLILFASDNVILQMKNFLNSADKSTCFQLGLAMRKDLYKLNSKLKSDDIMLK